jgi:predicted nuclease with TOPRIM domain
MSVDISDQERLKGFESSLKFLEDKLKAANDRNARLVTMNDELRARVELTEKWLNGIKDALLTYSREHFELERRGGK